jgi:hypothetical protein
MTRELIWKFAKVNFENISKRVENEDIESSYKNEIKNKLEQNRTLLERQYNDIYTHDNQKFKTNVEDVLNNLLSSLDADCGIYIDLITIDDIIQREKIFKKTQQSILNMINSVASGETDFTKRTDKQNELTRALFDIDEYYLNPTIDNIDFKELVINIINKEKEKLNKPVFTTKKVNKRAQENA